MIQFQLDDRSGFPPYLQLAQQVRQALLLNRLREGDQLPTVKDVATQLSVNQNTVLKAYRELEFDGLVRRRPGVGTFVRVSLTNPTATGPLREELARWLSAAQDAGLSDERIEALFTAELRAAKRATPSDAPTHPVTQGS